MMGGGGGGGGGGNRVEADRWLATSEKLLVTGDLHGAKNFAIRACETDPSLAEPAEFILAIADTLLAGESRIGGTNMPDWYAVLRLVRLTHNPELVATQYSRLAVLLNPNRNRLPYADQAFRLVSDAWYVLSDPSRKALYDRELQLSQFGQFGQLGFQLFNHPPQPQPHQPQPQQQPPPPAQQHQHQQHQTLSFQNQQLPLQLHPQPPQPPQPQFPAFQPQQPQPPQQQRLHFDQQLLQSQPLQPQPPQHQQHQQLRQEQTEPVRSGFRGKQPVEEERLFNLNNATDRIQQSCFPEPDPPSRSFEMAQGTRSPEPMWPPRAAPTRSSEPTRHPETIRMSEPIPPSETIRPSEPIRPPEPVRPSGPALPAYLTPVSQPSPVSRLPPVSQPPPMQQAPPMSQSSRPGQPTAVSQPTLPSQRTPVSQPARPSPPPPVSRPNRPSPPPPVSQPARPSPPVSQSATPPSLPPPVSQPTRPSSPSLGSQPTPSSEQSRPKRVVRSTEPRVPSFWTACPYCFVLYEYPNFYEDCVLRCQTKSCKRAFQAVKIPSPPPLTDDDGYYCCWGFFPIGFAAKPVPRKSSPVVYYDDDDLYIEISDPSEEDEDDHDWRWTGQRKKKGKLGRPKGSKRKYTRQRPGRRRNMIQKPVASQVSFEDSSVGSVGQMSIEAVPNKTNGTPRKQTQNPLSDQVSVDGRGGGSLGQISMVAGPSVGGERPMGSSGRKRTRASEKDVGKLDLNVEFSNEVEVSARSEGTVSGNGDETNIEGIGFFEGLDEFFSSLPILSSVTDDKVKAAD